MERRPEFRKLRKKKIADEIYDTLKQLIITGEWSIGEKIPSETELAEQFGVSRISTRAALQRLQNMGLLEVRRGDGTYVRDFSLGEFFREMSAFIFRPKSLQDIIDFRILLESETLRLAIERVADKERLVLRELLDKINLAEKAGDEEAFIKADFDFHRYICTISGNSLYEATYEMCHSFLTESYRSNFSLYISEETRTEADTRLAMLSEIPYASTHETVYEGIIKCDYQMARKALVQMIAAPLWLLHSEEDYIALLQSAGAQ